MISISSTLGSKMANSIDIYSSENSLLNKKVTAKRKNDSIASGSNNTLSSHPVSLEPDDIEVELSIPTSFKALPSNPTSFDEDLLLPTSFKADKITTPPEHSNKELSSEAIDNDVSAEFLSVYNKHKNEKMFPEERLDCSKYYKELEKYLKKNENPAIEKRATIIDLGIKAATLYYLHSKVLHNNLPSAKDLIKIQSFAKIFSLTANVLASKNLLEEGVRKLLGLEALRHGTSITNHVGISIGGGDPSRGGSAKGSSAGYNDNFFIDSSKNHFHVFLDEYGRDDYGYFLLDGFEKRVCPRIHSFLSGLQIGKNSISDEWKFCEKNWAGGFASVLFSPTLRFYYSPERFPGQFVFDEDYDGAAVKTPFRVKSNHLGIRGIIGEAVAYPKNALSSISEKLKNPRELAFIIACIAGSHFFAKLAHGNFDAIIKSSDVKAIPEITKNAINDLPKIQGNLKIMGINCTKPVLNMSAKLIKAVLKAAVYYFINVAK